VLVHQKDTKLMELFQVKRRGHTYYTTTVTFFNDAVNSQKNSIRKVAETLLVRMKSVVKGPGSS